MKEVKITKEGMIEGKFSILHSFAYSLASDMNLFISDEKLIYEKKITLPEIKKDPDGNITIINYLIFKLVYNFLLVNSFLGYIFVHIEIKLMRFLLKYVVIIFILLHLFN